MVEFLLDGLFLHYKADCISILFFTDENSVSASSTPQATAKKSAQLQPPIGMTPPST
jgi:hypothetical protein